MKMVLITQAISKGSGESVHPRSLARPSAFLFNHTIQGTIGSFIQRATSLRLALLRVCQASAFGMILEKVSLMRITSPYFELRENFESIEHIEKS